MLSRDFKEFVELLNANAVEYLIVGGYALAAHGHPRYTGDLDVCYPRRQTIVLGGLSLPIIHVDDFKANKRAIGRTKDLADLESLEDGDSE